MQTFVQWFSEHLSFLPPQLAVMLVSMLPLVELRGGIPFARLLMLPLPEAILFSVIGNILPIPFILLFIDKVFDWLRPTRHFGGFVQKLEDRAMSKSSGVSKAEFWGLVLIASMLKIDLKKASLAILLGIAIAATIMSLISYGVFRM